MWAATNHPPKKREFPVAQSDSGSGLERGGFPSEPFRPSIGAVLEERELRRRDRGWYPILRHGAVPAGTVTPKPHLLRITSERRHDGMTAPLSINLPLGEELI
ncbi:MAG: hypothetical protein CM15mV29_0030 [uncultured marine virus]|nr:MAG: hypothetical protein CM15mV29_0030 [uncultured marine virus]